MRYAKKYNRYMKFKGLKKAKKIYFIGIGGVSMSALAKLLALRGYCVSGSDEQKGEQTDMLAFYGVKTYFGEQENREELIASDIVVFTDAIPLENKELQSAIRLQKTVYSRAELLQIISGEFSNVIAVAGSHGKTTCTSMCAHILKELKAPFTAHIGGEDAFFKNFYSSGTEYLVTEACEYKQNLLKLSPSVAILLNIDKDHMECYPSVDALTDVFYQFCKQSKVAFVCADDERCVAFEKFPTFGISNPLSDYRAVQIRGNGERYSFVVEEYGRAICRVRLKTIGYCNIYNALAAFAAMRSFGFEEKEICKGIENFTAVKRRFEKIGSYKGASIICDYAHHPREIKSTLHTAKGICKGTLYVVFQPHTYSRTKLLMEEFVEVLRLIKNLVIYKTYPAREKYDGAGSAKTLSQMVGDCLYAENAYVLKTWIKSTLKDGDCLLFLGAGDIYHVAQHLLRELS